MWSSSLPCWSEVTTLKGVSCALQNSLQDLYGILSFLRVELLDSKAIFNRTIQRPIRAGESQGIMRVQVKERTHVCTPATQKSYTLNIKKQ